MTDKKQRQPYYKTALVIDDDTAVCKAIVRLLESLDFDVIHPAIDTNIGLDSLKNEVYDLVIIDWNVPGGGGLKIFNRLRRMPKYIDKGAIVISGFLGDRDFRLLDDFALTHKLQKPFNQDDFVATVMKLEHEARWLAQQKRNIADAFKNVHRDPKELLSIIREFLKQAPNPQPLASHAARTLIDHGFVKEAEVLLKELLRKAPENVVAMTELGKLYLQKKRYSDALRLLQNAQELSPDNLERICALGNAKLTTSEVESAEALFQKASKVDPDDVEVKAGLHLTRNINQFMATTPKKVVPNTFAGLLNAVGISMVKTSQYEQGIDHYKTAMTYVHEPKVQASLVFNLGLGFLRWKKDDEALEWFTKAVEFSGGKLDKAQVKIDKIKEIKAAAAAKLAEEQKKKEEAEKAKTEDDGKANADTKGKSDKAA